MHDRSSHFDTFNATQPTVSRSNEISRKCSRHYKHWKILPLVTKIRRLLKCLLKLFFQLFFAVNNISDEPSIKILFCFPSSKSLFFPCFRKSTPRNQCHEIQCARKMEQPTTRKNNEGCCLRFSSLFSFRAWVLQYPTVTQGGSTQQKGREL